MWCMYTMEYYSAVGKEEVAPFAAAWMDLENITLGEVSRKKLRAIDFTHMWDQKLKLQQQCGDDQREGIGGSKGS